MIRTCKRVHRIGEFKGPSIQRTVTDPVSGDIEKPWFCFYCGERLQAEVTKSKPKERRLTSVKTN